MGFLADFLPFYPKSASPRRRKAPRYDVDRALDVEMLPHPTLERRRADTGEVVLRITRQLHPAERLLGRFLGANPYRQLVLDRVGEFVLDAAFEEGVRLVEVASRLAAEFDLPLEDAKLGVVELVRELMLRDFVFLVRKG